MELIDREKLLEKAKEIGGIGCRDYCVDLKDILDAKIEVVRCKDCKNFKKYPTDSRFFICDPCPLNDEYAPFVKGDDFCSYGVRRDDN